jgi:hypothetical protein
MPISFFKPLPAGRSLATLVLGVVASAACGLSAGDSRAEEPRHWSGIYPHLASFNNENECGTGAVVPWQGRLWVITYAPHQPHGSSDKLYEIDVDLKMTIRPESVGGTPANRMIHRESNQLFIGPYVIDANRTVRVIPPSQMFGRLTGTARHLTDPAGKVYFATMEEGFYEVDVKTLGVTQLYEDGNRPRQEAGDILPGYHGKGLYSGQGRVVYTNNGENSAEARTRPDIDSGVLASWDGNDWTVVRRNQFTEVSGPGGIYGNPNPGTDPIWSIGWDHRSLILMVLDDGRWHAYRLPKATHSYDGAHGWNTEWPRIRDIGEDDLMMTMHGTFWRFPRDFSASQARGIEPRSTYLKVVGDFCRWEDRLVLGCDDAAASEFLNVRRSKGKIAGPAKSQSNLWFIEPQRLDQFGVPVGTGSVWLAEAVVAEKPSDPFLFNGYDHRAVHLVNGDSSDVVLTFQLDRQGNGKWDDWKEVTLAGGSYQWLDLTDAPAAAWVRLRTNRDVSAMTASFHLSDSRDRQRESSGDLFVGLAGPQASNYSAGLLRASGMEGLPLAFAANRVEANRVASQGLYKMGVDMRLVKIDDREADLLLREDVKIPQDVISSDDASIVFIDEDGTRYRLPVGERALLSAGPLGHPRTDREVCTERDLFQCGGLFYELPARNAGGFAKVRPITTHNRRLFDYCSWRGLMVISGVDTAESDNPHIIRSEDGEAAVWVGTIDDLWQFGKAVGVGGPWMNTAVKANQPSDAYLFNGFDQRTLTVRHDAAESVTVGIEIDIQGTGDWQPYKPLRVPAGEEVSYSFPAALHGYWIRTVTDLDCVATAQLEYR